MKIIVCLKQVPGTTEVEIDPQTNTLRRQGIKNITNPFDTYALEEGVRLRERFGGTVTAISMGPPQAEEMLREAISLGADDAVLISDRALAGSDTLATAYTLSQVVLRLGCDLAICGRQSIDGDTGQVGPEMAEMLAWPFAAYVSRVRDVTGSQMTVERMVEEGYEVLEVPLPAVMSVVKEINVPRLPSLRGTRRARRAEIPVWTVAEMGIDAGRVGLAGSPTTVQKVFFPQRQRRGEMLEGGPAEQVEALVERLRGLGIG